MRLCSLTVGVLCAIVAAVGPAAAQQTRPALLGVYDAHSGSPIEGAVVRDTLGAQAITSPDGVVALTYISAIGPVYLIEVRKIGYRPLHLKIRVDSLTDRTELLEPLPLGAASELPAMVSTAKYNIALDSGLWNGFAARCTLQSVTCFNVLDLSARPSANLIDFIDKVGGAIGACGTTMTRGARPRRVAGAGGRTLDCVKMRGIGVQAATLCVPTYYVDGFTRGNAENTLDLIEESLRPGEVKGIEVYLSGEPMPPRLSGMAGNQGCGVVAIWTK